MPGAARPGHHRLGRAAEVHEDAGWSRNGSDWFRILSTRIPYTKCGYPYFNSSNCMTVAAATGSTPTRQRINSDQATQSPITDPHMNFSKSRLARAARNPRSTRSFIDVLLVVLIFLILTTTHSRFIPNSRWSCRWRRPNPRGSAARAGRRGGRRRPLRDRPPPDQPDRRMPAHLAAGPARGRAQDSPLAARPCS